MVIEGAGFDTKIALNYGLTTKNIEAVEKHSWIMVNTTDGLVSVDPKKLIISNYKPPGIITKPNGEFKKY